VAGRAARGSASACCGSSGAGGGRGAVSVFRLRRGLGGGVAANRPHSSTTATVPATRMFRDRDRSLIGEISYRITESDQDREQAQCHGGNDQSVFGQSRSRLAGPKPSDELSHGPSRCRIFHEPDAESGGGSWKGQETCPREVLTHPTAQSLRRQRLSKLGPDGPRIVGQGNRLAGCKKPHILRQCGGYPRFSGAGAPPPA
jgi:hypothetical protein